MEKTKESLNNDILMYQKKIEKLEHSIYNPFLFSVASTGVISLLYTLFGHLALPYNSFAEFIYNMGELSIVIGIPAIPIITVGIKEINEVKRQEISEFKYKLYKSEWNLQRLIDKESKEIDKNKENDSNINFISVNNYANDKTKVKSLIKKI